VPYLDYAATAPLRAEVLEAMRPFLERPVANPSSQHGPGRAARAAVETAREQVAALAGADPAQVVFTSGGTEADNLAIKGTVLLREPGARHLVVSAVEHHAVLEAAEWAVVDAGATVALAPVDGRGRIDVSRLGELIQPGRTALVAVMAANNEVGPPRRPPSWHTAPARCCSATRYRPPATRGSTWPPMASTWCRWPATSWAAPPGSARW
jgi:cysteine desulfurase